MGVSRATAGTLEKSLQLVSGRNAVVLTYTLLGGDRPVELLARPLLALRGIHELSYQWNRPAIAMEAGSGILHVPADHADAGSVFSLTTGGSSRTPTGT